jgi:hypothetical protein
MATGDQITDPEILRQLNMGGARPAAPRVVVPATTGPLKPFETPGGKAAGAQAEASIPTPAIYQDLTAARSQVATIGKQIDRVEQLYNRSLKGIEPWRVAREYFPGIAPTSSVSKDVKAFNTAASQLFSLASQITRIPGEGDQNMREFLQKLEAYKPSSGDTDTSVEEKIRGLRTIIDERRSFLDARIAEVRPPKSPAMRAAQAAIAPRATKTIRYDAQGNRIQ